MVCRVKDVAVDDGSALRIRRAARGCPATVAGRASGSAFAPGSQHPVPQVGADWLVSAWFRGTHSEDRRSAMGIKGEGCRTKGVVVLRAAELRLHRIDSISDFAMMGESNESRVNARDLLALLADYWRNSTT